MNVKELDNLLEQFNNLSLRYENEHRALQDKERQEVKVLLKGYKTRKEKKKRTAKPKVGDLVRIVNPPEDTSSTGKVLSIGNYYYIIRVNTDRGNTRDIRRIVSNITTI